MKKIDFKNKIPLEWEIWKIGIKKSYEKGKEVSRWGEKNAKAQRYHHRYKKFCLNRFLLADGSTPIALLLKMVHGVQFLDNVF